MTRFIINPYLLIAMMVSLLFGCQPKGIEMSVEYDDDNCQHNGSLTAEQRNSFYPFNTSYKIQVISFPSSLWKAPLEADTINTTKTIENITLSTEQIANLTDVLYNYNYPKVEEIQVYALTDNGCYYPRHAIVFLDKDDRIIEYFEVCLECQGYKTSIPEENLGVFCQGKYDLIKAFFKSIGITHFEDDPWINTHPSPED